MMGQPVTCGCGAHGCACSRGGLRCRYLDSNQISTIANGTFAALTVLTQLYGAGLCI
jgi:hypothetical protein